MNELEKLLEQIEKWEGPLKQVNETINKLIPPYIQKLNAIFSPTIRQLDEINKIFQPQFIKINESFLKIAHLAQEWQKKRKKDVVEMADNGWYPNWFTFFYTPDKELDSIDELMILHLEDNWKEIEDKILKTCPNRKHILENAFNLHIIGNYEAAIPLFFAQADGICCETFKSFLFTRNDIENKIKKLMDDGEVEANMFTDFLLEPFKIKNHHNAGIKESSQIKKNKAPNRNGILHGHRKHLDYGTKINSLKAFSLLSFVVYTADEIKKNQNS